MTDVFEDKRKNNEYTELSTCFFGQAHRTGLSSAVYNLQAITLERGLTYAHPKGSYCRFPCHKKINNQSFQ